MSPNYVIVALQILGSLGLLIYGMKTMSDALEKMAGPHLRHGLAKMTTNRVTGMMTGLFVTSSHVTIIIFLAIGTLITCIVQLPMVLAMFHTCFNVT